MQAIYDLKVGYTLGNADISMLKSIARQLLAELESRTVTVNLPSKTDFDDPLSAYEAIEKCRDEIKSACAAAGIQVIEGEG